MMEENSDISLAGGDALMYLTGPMHKYSTTFVFGHPFSTYVCVCLYSSTVKASSVYKMSV